MLGVNESRSRFAPPERLNNELSMLPQGVALLHSLAQIRYVDDLLAVSMSLCVPCLTRFAHLQHEGIPFSLQYSTDKGPLFWLDLMIYAARAPPHISMCLHERDYILERSEVPGQFRVQPWLGRQHFDGRTHRANLRGCLARWGQAQLGHSESIRVLSYTVCLHVRVGYPHSLVFREWLAASHDHLYGALVEGVVALLRRAAREP